MFKFILEVLFTVLCAVLLVVNVIAGSWLFVILDAIIVILGIINSILEFKEWRSGRKK